LCPAPTFGFFSLSPFLSLHFPILQFLKPSFSLSLPAMDWDERVELRHEKITLEWVGQLRQSRPHIPAWISTFRDNQPCQILDDHHGSFNWSLSLRFNDGVEWLVRFPVPGRVMQVDEKTAREVEISRFIKRNTIIPIPTIHMWGLSKDNPLGLGPFIIMDFIHGASLGKIW
jgi:hypothetical protein